MEAISKRTRKVVELLDSMGDRYIGIATHIRVHAFTSFVFMTAEAMVIELELVDPTDGIAWDTVIYEMLLEHMTLGMEITEDGITYDRHGFDIGGPSSEALVHELLLLYQGTETTEVMHAKLSNMIYVLACDNHVTVRTFNKLSKQIEHIVDSATVYSSGHVLFNNLIHGPNGRDMFSVTVIVLK